MVVPDGAQFIVVYWNVQEYEYLRKDGDIVLDKKGNPLPDLSKPLLYTAHLRMINTDYIFILKDLETASSKVMEMPIKSPNMNSRVILKTGDIIGTIRSWNERGNPGKIGLHLAITTRGRQYFGLMQVIRSGYISRISQNSISPCSGSSPVRYR